MGKAIVRINVNQTGYREYRATATACDKAGEPFFKLDEYFTNSNNIFPAYKMLAKTITRLARFEIKLLDVETNVSAIIEELSGNENENTTLRDMVDDRLRKTKIQINEIKGANENEQQKA